MSLYKPSSKVRRMHRVQLWNERDGLCHWCGIRTVLDFAGPRQPDNLATVDHLDDHWSGRRDPRADWKHRTVLACFRCNQARERESRAFAEGRIELWTHA